MGSFKKDFAYQAEKASELSGQCTRLEQRAAEDIRSMIRIEKKLGTVGTFLKLNFKLNSIFEHQVIQKLKELVTLLNSCAHRVDSAASTFEAAGNTSATT